jgi:NADPH:quinone reductase-like Zn-dependent oxidoreductase
MRAAIYRSFGPALDTIELADWELGALQHGDVRVEVEATPVHFGDLLYVEGRLANAPPPPAVAGSEGIGRVVEIGPGVEGFHCGQRVFLPRKSGTFAQQMRVAASRLVPAPGHGDPLQLSLVPVNALTSYLLLTRVVKLQPGEWLLQNAANSSCGRFNIGIARRLGLRSVNVVRRPELVDELLAAGADVVLLDGDDLHQRVARATEGAALRFAIDSVAGEATTRLARCLALDGVIAIFGLMSLQPCSVPAELMFLNNLRLQGYFMPHYERGIPRQEWLEIMRQLGEWVAAGELRAKIACLYTLQQVREAFRHELESGAARDGKIILLPNG